MLEASVRRWKMPALSDPLSLPAAGFVIVIVLPTWRTPAMLWKRATSTPSSWVRI
jgi:hypothetical protein